jgi:hypothetical protein
MTPPDPRAELAAAAMAEAAAWIVAVEADDRVARATQPTGAVQ